MTTYSQMIDELVSETMHPEHRASMLQWAHQTIRELHFRDGAGLKYPDNLWESEITANVDTGFTWAIPNPSTFQVMESVWYETIGLYSRPRTPASAFAFMEEINGDVYHYRSGSYICFSGYGGNGGIIDLAWYEYPRGTTYYAAGSRPAEWDEANQTWIYGTGYDVSDATRANALTLTTCWMIQRYKEIIKEGVRAKLYKRLNDMDRAKLSFSSFSTLKVNVYGEATDTTPLYAT